MAAEWPAFSSRSRHLGCGRHRQREQWSRGKSRCFPSICRTSSRAGLGHSPERPAASLSQPRNPVRPASEPLVAIQSDARVTSLASSGSGGEGPVWLLVVLVLMLLLLMCRLVRSTETERSFPKSFCTRRSSEEIERAPTLAKSICNTERREGGRDEWHD